MTDEFPTGEQDTGVTTDPPERNPAVPVDHKQRLSDASQRRAALLVEKEKRELLETWLSGGGTETDFEDAWPSIRDQLGRSRLQEVGDAARRRPLSRFRRSS
jgi:hypothetical protein